MRRKSRATETGALVREKEGVAIPMQIPKDRSYCHLDIGRPRLFPKELCLLRRLRETFVERHDTAGVQVPFA